MESHFEFDLLWFARMQKANPSKSRSEDANCFLTPATFLGSVILQLCAQWPGLWEEASLELTLFDANFTAFYVKIMSFLC